MIDIAEKRIIGRTIKTRRLEVNLKLITLAKKVEITPSALSQIEHGKTWPSVKTLIRISDILNISVDEILGGRGKRIFNSFSI